MGIACMPPTAIAQGGNLRLAGFRSKQKGLPANLGPASANGVIRGPPEIL